MKKLLIFMLPLFVLWSCSDDDKAPADANDNFITELSLTVSDGTVYEAAIVDDEITMTVPYTVSLDGAMASIVYTPSATIFPNPKEITNWDEERIFRVVSYNGEERRYTYLVEKAEISEEGDVELKTSADIASFAAKGTSMIKGNLTIGSDNGEEIKSLEGLENLKEISGSLIILNSFTGEDLTGLDNLRTIGGLKIGDAESYSSVPLEYISLNALKKIEGDFNVFNNNLKYIDLKDVETIEGSLNIGSSSLVSIQGGKLINIDGDYYVTSVSNGNPGGEMTQFSLPELRSVEGKLSAEMQSNLREISFPKLVSAGSIIFEKTPLSLATVSFPEIEKINGDCNFISQSAFQAIGSSYSGNTVLKDFEGFDKLKNISGNLKVSFFTATTNIPNISAASVKNVYLEYLSGLETVNLISTEFDNSEQNCKVEMTRMSPTKIVGHQRMDCEFRFIEMYFLESNGLPSFSDVDEVNGLYISGVVTTNREYTTTLKKINGNLYFDLFWDVLEDKISFPNLTKVDGYVYITGADQYSTINLSMPLLETVGGQMYVGGTGLNNYNLSSIKNVSVGITTTVLDIDDSSDMFFNDFGNGYGLNLHLTTPGNSFLPNLTTVGGNGLRLNITDMFNGNPVTTIELKSLKTISNSLVLESTVWGDANVNMLSFPNLNSVDKISISSLSALSDFTTFGHLFTDGKISSESDWNVTGCLYNPSFNDMKAGKCKPSESALTNLSKTIESRKAAIKKLSRSLKK